MNKNNTEAHGPCAKFDYFQLTYSYNLYHDCHCASHKSHTLYVYLPTHNSYDHCPSEICHLKNWYLFNFVLIFFSDGLVVSHLPFGPTAYFTLSNTVMRHDIPKIGTMSEAYPHLIFHNFNSKLGERVKSILKYLYPVPKDDSRRVITFANQEDYISFRHHTYKKVDGQVELTEVGPRFEMKGKLST
ncbi:U3 small nucleolar ribonucleoprotein protein IMP4-like [Orbicella faveolata]|uniref:U3 small nucleolar ribonucleoprotein protein IMP4-like n=1 Tax=Orbicella faveolata TaxID=48498 RepID=UPI0009E25178|nr:U3 small nucleolar ribonucleoprotein protein IMP4-like [Orbicella faveolata]